MKTLLKTLFFGTCFGMFCLVLGYQQGSDAKWAVHEAELAASKAAYAKGYNKGSSMGLVAAHTACTAKLEAIPASCDWLLANAVVAYADEVR
jgi:hypothetical protein